MDSYEIIKHPLSTEKAVRLMESENTIMFIVDERANKSTIKKAVENMFNVKVEKVRVANGKDGKKAYIRLSKDANALDIATEMGMI